MAYSKKSSSRSRKRNKITVASGIVYIGTSFNNTFTTITDQVGNVVKQETAGTCGFKGSAKGTPYAAQVVTKKAVTAARDELGMKTAIVYMKGPGQGRDSSIRALDAVSGLRVLFIKDITSLPFNGPRRPKQRRV